MARKASPPPAAPADDRLIGTDEFRRLLGIHERTLFRWIADGRVPPPIRLSARRHRWRWSVVQAFLDQLQGSGKQPA